MNKILEYLEENSYLLDELVQECNCYDGWFDDIICHQNDDDFYETFYSGREMELARAVYYGDYDYDDEMIYIDVYGNLITLSQEDYFNNLQNNKEDIIEHFIKLYKNDDINIYNDELKELKELIDEYLESEVK